MRNIFQLKERPGEEAPKAVHLGYDTAFIGGTLNLPSSQHTFGLATASKTAKANLPSNIVSTFQDGAFFGSAIGFFLAERFGRKLIIMLSAVIFTIGAILQMIGRLDVLYAGRVFTGWGVGSSAMILSIYVSECSPALIRGRLVGVFEIMLQIALVFGFWVNYGVNKNISSATERQWHIPVSIQLVPAGLLVICMLPMIESPRWLVSKGKTQAAAKALSWVRNLLEEHPWIQREIGMVENAVESEIASTGLSRSWRQIGKELFSNSRLINAINYYSLTIFTSIGFTGTSNGLLATGIFGIIKMVATILYAGFLVDKLGRRNLLLIGGVGAGISMFYLAGYSQISGSFERTPPLGSGARAAVVMAYIYALFYGLSWNGVPWLFCSEVLPQRFVVVYSLPHMVLGIKYGTFLFFGVCTVLAIIFAYLFVPETKGGQLEDMDLISGPEVSIIAKKAKRNYEEVRNARVLVAEEKGGVLYKEEKV
ncbi:general substrate transporter [Lophiotrema nucula]|uniref:Quinate transporter n=1 Tax=Lophiotrema nucula TaxID=690887 RepID=A0A6A5ZJM4_9PLEO|nr:general substrate transporter [Lophiotrema nucula]